MWGILGIYWASFKDDNLSPPGFLYLYIQNTDLHTYSYVDILTVDMCKRSVTMLDSEVKGAT